MRPRRRILLIDAREDRRGVTSFVLETAGYFTVIGAASIYEAAELARGDAANPDVLVGYSPISEQYLMDVAGELKLPWVFIRPTLPGKKWPSMADLLERVRIAAIKRRGPPKGTPRPPMTIKPAPVEACA